MGLYTNNCEDCPQVKRALKTIKKAESERELLWIMKCARYVQNVARAKHLEMTNGGEK